MPRPLAVIHANLQAARLRERADVVRSDVFRYLAGEPEPFDLVYIAPPQYQGLWSTTLLALDAEPGWLSPDGVAIVQIFPKEFESLALENLALADQRRYGSTEICLYEPAARE